MDSILQQAINSVQKSEVAFSKFISANDAGKTGGHQSGYYISKSFLPFVFGEEIIKGNDYTALVKIKWQNTFETDSRFKFYGSKNECHLTRFGTGFPFLTDNNVGDLFILCKISSDYYEAFVLQTDDDIEDFFAELNMSSTETSGIIPKQFELTAEEKLYQCFLLFLKSLKIDFPTTYQLALQARNCYNSAFTITEKIIKANPDKGILDWLNAEFQLFKTIENDRYSKRIQTPFKTVEELVETANTILNRRKSRAGKSLEHHLGEIFDTFKLTYESQSVTEDKKKPDFLFPNAEAYLNLKFDEKKLIVLASKTTCKDRWRQILNEADRVKVKHLFTLQQGISNNQLEEMYKYNVCLVVPKPYLKNFPDEFRDKILTLDSFVKHVQFTQQ
jgi:hypothetical protein